jgi:ATP/maltotriose-dependent transcriptional regulator MalT
LERANLFLVPLDEERRWWRLHQLFADLLAKSLVALLDGRVEEVEPLLDGAERASAEIAGDAEPFEPSVGRAASVLANLPATIAVERAILAELRGDAEATVAFASQALAVLGEGEWMLQSQARAQLGMAEWLRGRLGDAERTFTSVIAGWRAAGEPFLAAWGCDRLGLIQYAQGRLDAALKTYQQALELADASDRPVLPATVAHVGMAEVAYQRGELDAALAHATEGVALSRRRPPPACPGGTWTGCWAPSSWPACPCCPLPGPAGRPRAGWCCRSAAASWRCCSCWPTADRTGRSPRSWW